MADNNAGDKLNLNTANCDELAKIPGVGRDFADLVVQQRDKAGSFTAMEELDKIKGFGGEAEEALRHLKEHTIIH